MNGWGGGYSFCKFSCGKRRCRNCNRYGKRYHVGHEKHIYGGDSDKGQHGSGVEKNTLSTKPLLLRYQIQNILTTIRALSKGGGEMAHTQVNKSDPNGYY